MSRTTFNRTLETLRYGTLHDDLTKAMGDLTESVTRTNKTGTLTLKITVRDLEQAKRDYLSAMQHAEYYASIAQYNDGLISRLGNYVREAE